jgi:hypothetical protein
MRADEPAFPTQDDDASRKGLTVREHLAAMAMQGLLACPEVHGTEHVLAKDAVIFADALIAALARTAPAT